MVVEAFAPKETSHDAIYSQDSNKEQRRGNEEGAAKSDLEA